MCRMSAAIWAAGLVTAASVTALGAYPATGRPTIIDSSTAGGNVSAVCGSSWAPRPSRTRVKNARAAAANNDGRDVAVLEADGPQLVYVGLRHRRRISGHHARELVHRTVLCVEGPAAGIDGNGSDGRLVPTHVAKELGVRGGAVGRPQRPGG